MTQQPWPVSAAHGGAGGQREEFLDDGTTTRCHAWFTVGNLGQCEQPAETVLAYGCIHEHLGTATMCPGCADWIRKLTADGAFVCNVCQRAGHYCRNAIYGEEPVNAPDDEEDVLIG